MNPVFWLLVIIAAILLWSAISFIFIPLGRIILRKVNKILDILEEENED